MRLGGHVVLGVVVLLLTGAIGAGWAWLIESDGADHEEIGPGTVSACWPNASDSGASAIWQPVGVEQTGQSHDSASWVSVPGVSQTQSSRDEATSAWYDDVLAGLDVPILPPGDGELTGTVVDHNGDPIASVTVAAVPTLPPAFMERYQTWSRATPAREELHRDLFDLLWRARNVRTTESNADGWFAFTQLPGQSVRVYAAKRRHIFEEPARRGPIDLPAEITIVGSALRDVRLVPTVNGEPYTGNLHVRVEGQAFPGQSWRPDHDVIVLPLGTLTLDISPFYDFIAPPVTITIEPGEGVLDIPVELQHRWALVLTVTGFEELRNSRIRLCCVPIAPGEAASESRLLADDVRLLNNTSHLFRDANESPHRMAPNGRLEPGDWLVGLVDVSRPDDPVVLVSARVVIGHGTREVALDIPPDRVRPVDQFIMHLRIEDHEGMPVSFPDVSPRLEAMTPAGRHHIASRIQGGVEQGGVVVFADTYLYPEARSYRLTLRNEADVPVWSQVFPAGSLPESLHITLSTPTLLTVYLRNGPPANSAGELTLQLVDRASSYRHRVPLQLTDTTEYELPPGTYACAVLWSVGTGVFRLPADDVELTSGSQPLELNLADFTLVEFDGAVLHEPAVISVYRLLAPVPFEQLTLEGLAASTDGTAFRRVSPSETPARLTLPNGRYAMLVNGKAMRELILTGGVQTIPVVEE